MKKGTHPTYMKCDVICSCGENRGVLFTTRSTVPQIKVEICSFCHPYFTGKQKIIDSAGRVEKFNRKFAKRSLSSKQSQQKKLKLKLCRSYIRGSKN
jgi:large subunit ribosomal protein L31